MDLKIEKEEMNSVFTKYHIKGLPFDAVIHNFTEKDKNEHIHDHPFSFTTHILKGNYTERVYYKHNGEWVHRDFIREEGDSHLVHSECIHEIIEVSDGGCFTLIRPNEWEQEVSFYRFEDGKALKRKWNESEFKEI